MRVSWPVAVTGWRGGVWRGGGGYGGGDTPATGTRIARLLPPPCRRAAGPRHHAATTTSHTSADQHSAYSLLPYTWNSISNWTLITQHPVSMKAGDPHPAPSTPAARLQWTLCYLYKNMMFVSESWIIDIWRDARTRSSEDTEDMSQGDSLNWNHHLTTDWCLAGAQLGRCTQILD